jgi:hypothetical protein
MARDMSPSERPRTAGPTLTQLWPNDNGEAPAERLNLCF